MAKRPIFIVSEDPNFLFIEKEIEFQWFAGLSVSQKQKFRRLTTLKERMFKQQERRNKRIDTDASYRAVRRQCSDW